MQINSTEMYNLKDIHTRMKPPVLLQGLSDYAFVKKGPGHEAVFF